MIPGDLSTKAQVSLAAITSFLNECIKTNVQIRTDTVLNRALEKPLKYQDKRNINHMSINELMNGKSTIEKAQGANKLSVNITC